ncbi:MAG: hypothetical protein U0232_17710 [Thermomicrobiales bacterium]
MAQISPHPHSRDQRAVAGSDPWFYKQRSEALSGVYLTRQPDILALVQRSPLPEVGDSILVRPRAGGTSPVWSFAVVPKGFTRRGARRGDVLTDIPVRLRPADVTDRGMPTSLFLFDLDSEQGYHRWLYAPDFSSQGVPILDLDPSIRPEDFGEGDQEQLVVVLRFAPLDNSAISAMIERVADWYAAKTPRNDRMFATGMG